MVFGLVKCNNKEKPSTKVDCQCPTSLSDMFQTLIFEFFTTANTSFVCTLLFLNFFSLRLCTELVQEILDSYVIWSTIIIISLIFYVGLKQRLIHSSLEKRVHSSFFKLKYKCKISLFFAGKKIVDPMPMLPKNVSSCRP